MGLSAPGSFGPFVVVELDNGVSLDFSIAPQGYLSLDSSRRKVTS
jgi:hypothetical protein